MINTIKTYDGLKEMGRVLLEKMTSSDTGKFAVFSVFAGTMIYGLKEVLTAMNGHTDIQNN